ARAREGAALCVGARDAGGARGLRGRHPRRGRRAVRGGRAGRAAHGVGQRRRRLAGVAEAPALARAGRTRRRAQAGVAGGARRSGPSASLSCARRFARGRGRRPVGRGTSVAQTLLSVVARVVLGSIMFASLRLFQGHDSALVVATILPVVVLAVVLSRRALL